MIVTTTPEIAGKTIVEYKGLVFGEVIGKTEAVWKNSYSGDHENLMKILKQRSLNKLIEQAEESNANAIIGISINHNYHIMGGGTYITFSATGTAVAVE